MGTHLKRRPFAPISPQQVRYIKLGGKGKWEKECIKKGIIRIGFWTGKQEVFLHCSQGKWAWVKSYWEKRGKRRGTATGYSNQLQQFFEDKGQTLWMTFYKRRLFWAFVDGSKAERHADGEGSFRRVKDRWRDYDASNQDLAIEKLPGFLTMLQAFQGTSCEVRKSQYVIDRINGRRSEVVAGAVGALDGLIKATTRAIKHLDPFDLELLVDLIFSSSGWRRVSRVGKTEKTTDIVLILPTTGDKALVQVKSKTTQQEFEDYQVKFGELQSRYSRMFYVYHTGTVRNRNKNVFLIGADKLARMVVEAGLTQWVIDKVS